MPQQGLQPPIVAHIMAPYQDCPAEGWRRAGRGSWLDPRAGSWRRNRTIFLSEEGFGCAFFG